MEGSSCTGGFLRERWCALSKQDGLEERSRAARSKPASEDVGRFAYATRPVWHAARHGTGLESLQVKRLAVRGRRLFSSVT